jgi:hypothetical protein
MPELLNPSISPIPERRARAVAFYLPQFYPVRENDEWWGPGFTEWTNLAKARPLFCGHVQPHIPADLGFYDLRCAETRQAQADMAARYGVEAFCYWHYWFGNGRRLLERPFHEVLTSGAPAQKFCLGWANQTWTGTWHGAPNRILVEQTYPGVEDEREHFKYLLQAFTDNRYFCIDGKPLYFIFRPEQLPDQAGFARRMREMAKAEGLGGLYLVAEISDLLGQGPRAKPPEAYGFDAGVYIRLPADTSPRAILKMRLRRKLLRWPETYTYTASPHEPPEGYRQDNIHPCVYPNWDNTPRSMRAGLVLQGSRPELFRPHVRAAIQRIAHLPADRRLLFIKSWNEWAEGNYLEPDLEHGHGFLRVLDEELKELSPLPLSRDGRII